MSEEKEPENISSGIKRFFDNADYFVKRSKSLILGIVAGIGAIVLAFTQLGGSDGSAEDGYYEDPYYEEGYYEDSSYDEGYDDSSYDEGYDDSSYDEGYYEEDLHQEQETVSEIPESVEEHSEEYKIVKQTYMVDDYGYRMGDTVYIDYYDDGYIDKYYKSDHDTYYADE